MTTKIRITTDRRSTLTRITADRGTGPGWTPRQLSSLNILAIREAIGPALVSGTLLEAWFPANRETHIRREIDRIESEEA